MATAKCDDEKLNQILKRVTSRHLRSLFDVAELKPSEL